MLKLVEKQCIMCKIVLRGSLCMAKKRLTKEAIAFIIECRDDPTRVNTWEDVAKMVNEKFGIEMSFQGIAKSYKTNKDKISINQIKKQSNQSSEIIQSSNDNKIQAFQELKKIETRTQTQNKEFVEFDDDEFNAMLKGE